MKKISDLLILTVFLLVLAGCEKQIAENSGISSETGSRAVDSSDPVYETGVGFKPQGKLIRPQYKKLDLEFISPNNHDKLLFFDHTLIYFQTPPKTDDGPIYTPTYCKYDIDSDQSTPIATIENVGDREDFYVLQDKRYLFYAPQIENPPYDEYSHVGLVKLDLAESSAEVLYTKPAFDPSYRVARVDDDHLLISAVNGEKETGTSFSEIYNWKTKETKRIFSSKNDDKQTSGMVNFCSTAANGKIYCYLNEWEGEKTVRSYINVYAFDGSLLQTIDASDAIAQPDSINVWNDYVFLQYPTFNSSNAVWKIKDNKLERIFQVSSSNPLRHLDSFQPIEESFPYAFIWETIFVDGQREYMDIHAFNIKTGEIKTFTFDTGEMCPDSKRILDILSDGKGSFVLCFQVEYTNEKDGSDDFKTSFVYVDGKEIVDQMDLH